PPVPARCRRPILAALVVLGLLPVGGCSRDPAGEPDPVLARIAAQIAGSEDPERVALLVGVGELAPGSDPGFASLHGCGNDVRRVAELLVERFDFAREDVVVLLDGEATHERVVRAFESVLLARARPGAELL